MNRIALAVTAALLLSPSLALANDLVPGSDTRIRSEQSRADTAVANGRFQASGLRAVSTGGYATPVPSLGGIVPGSDTAIRDRHSAEDVAVARGTFDAHPTQAYGYPAGHGAAASDRSDDRAVNQAAGAPVTGMNGVLVPGSDSF